MDTSGQNARKKTLVGDDEPHKHAVLPEGLSQKGYKVVLAKNGLQGLSDIPFQPFGLVITNWKVPLRDGISIAKPAKVDAESRSTVSSTWAESLHL
jgi:DNA-binding response OmpR family regulator